jgi:hypothetical protein
MWKEEQVDLCPNSLVQHLGFSGRCVWNIPVESFVLTKGAGLIVPVVFWISF